MITITINTERSADAERIINYASTIQQCEVVVNTPSQDRQQDPKVASSVNSAIDLLDFAGTWAEDSRNWDKVRKAARGEDVGK